MTFARVCAFTLVGLLASPVFAAVPAGFQESAYTSSALVPTTRMAWAPDGSGRLFLLNKNGTVRIATLNADELVTQADTKLALSLFATEPSIHTNSESGLLGIAFDPNFVVNRYVYFFVTVSASKAQIVRYTDVAGIGTARTVIVDNLPTNGQNHNGGSLAVGHDGKLYWGIGDLGNGTGIDADLTSLAAKIGRAHLDGTPVSDNPFYDGVGPNNEYIWARGFRNPFAITVQPATGNIWVDVAGTGYEQIFVASEGSHAGYNDYENNQPTGYLVPAIKYRTNGSDTRFITASGITRSGGVITVTTTGTHGFRKGERITLSGVTDASFNGDVYVSSTPTATTWTASQSGPDASSGGGTAQTAQLGGAITGGTFYDSTLFPSEYRGNFLFGDYNSGQVTRAQLAADSSVASVDAWASGFSSAVALDVGPDGALYVVGVTSSTIRRIAPTSPGQKLIVSPLHLSVVEKGEAVVAVRLAEAPLADVIVDVQQSSGDTDLGLVSPSQLTFTTANWNQLQIVRIAAASDADEIDDAAEFTLSSGGLAAETVQVRSIDNNAPSLVLSANPITVDEGGTQSFTVALSEKPSANMQVTVMRTSGDEDITVTAGQTLLFNLSNWAVPQSVTIEAAADADFFDDTATITVAAAGGDARAVSVTVRDTNPRAPVITSTPVTIAIEGLPYQYDVDADGYPESVFSLDTAAPGMTIDATSGVISWTPLMDGLVDVAVRANNGVSPDAVQSFQIQVVANSPPVPMLLRPTLEERVSGTTAEFYGDCSDDLGCVKAEFYVDDVLGSTDTTGPTRFYFGGAPSLWDTTALLPGSHTVRMVVFDTAGQSASVETKVCVGDGPCVPYEAPDAGMVEDAGTSVDAGMVDDAGTTVDAGIVVDAGTAEDGGTIIDGDGGTTPAPNQTESGGCGCNAEPASGIAFLGMLLLLRRKR